MNSKIITVLTSLCISPAVLFSDGACQEVAKTECIAQPKSRSCVQPKKMHKIVEETCDVQSPRPERIEVRHIEANGVGYNQGYSTLEGFFTIPSTLDGAWIPFLDLRGHIFNDGKPAANAGAGLRYLGSSRVYGANVYYDYRKTHRFHSNQVGFGLETLGEIWDFRVNGYLPVGKKDSHLFHTRFHEFKHNSIILSSRKEIAMKGGNAEVGVHALRKENYKLYAAAGPYYFEEQARVAWGGEGRVALTLFDYLRLQLSGSYDKIFKGIVQGEAALTFSFGGKRVLKYSKGCNTDNSYCSQRRMVQERALQRVDRQEIIVVTKKHQKTKAIDPVTGHAYKVWFVDNTSHSQGTFESPFNTLADAQNSSGPNDIIYVFPGDGTDTGMNGGIMLKKGQQLLGAGIGQQVETTKGLINIRAHAKGLPMISNTLTPQTQGGLYHAAVLLSEGDNVVSGLFCVDKVGQGLGIPGAGAGIRVNDGINYLIKNNILSASAQAAVSPNVPNSDALSIFGGGNVIAENNTMIARDADGSFGISLFSLVSPLQGYFVLKNNIFMGANGSTGFQRNIFALLSKEGANSSLGLIGNISLDVVGNSIHSSLSAAPMRGINVQTVPNDGSPIKVKINNNNITIPNITATAGVFVVTQGNAPTIVSMHENVSLTTTPTPGYFFINSTGHLQLDFGSDNFGTSTGP
ncbi:MAG: inverse autotransporter beta domain-containing protein [Verrucomicrobia bacterium]|nr:inverse autotransporter beta domain-containing protein [Verrucomicrobiota bacterium]